MQTRLYRSRTDKMIAGVCSGLGHYLAIDPTWVRLFFVLMALATAGSVSLMAYLILWVVMPYADAETAPAQPGDGELSARMHQVGDEMRESLRTANSGFIVGGALVFLGLAFLVQNLGIRWLHWFNLSQFWPLLVIAFGVMIIVRRSQLNQDDDTSIAQER